MQISSRLGYAWALLWPLLVIKLQSGYIFPLSSLNSGLYSQYLFVMSELPRGLTICKHNYLASWCMHGLCFGYCLWLSYSLDISSLAFLLILGSIHNKCLWCVSFLTALLIACAYFLPIAVRLVFCFYQCLCLTYCLDMSFLSIFTFRGSNHSICLLCVGFLMSLRFHIC